MRLKSLDEIATVVGQVEMSLRALADMGGTIGTYSDDLGAQFGSLAGILADALVPAFCALNERAMAERKREEAEEAPAAPTPSAHDLAIEAALQDPELVPKLTTLVQSLPREMQASTYLLFRHVCEQRPAPPGTEA